MAPDAAEVGLGATITKVAVAVGRTTVAVGDSVGTAAIAVGDTGTAADGTPVEEKRKIALATTPTFRRARATMIRICDLDIEGPPSNRLQVPTFSELDRKGKKGFSGIQSYSIASRRKRQFVARAQTCKIEIGHAECLSACSISYTQPNDP